MFVHESEVNNAIILMVLLQYPLVMGESHLVAHTNSNLALAYLSNTMYQS